MKKLGNRYLLGIGVVALLLLGYQGWVTLRRDEPLEQAATKVNASIESASARDLWGYLDAREIELLQLDQAKLQVMLDGVHRRLAKLRKDGGLDQERMAGGGALLASQTYRTADGAWVYLGFEVAKNAEGPRVSISYPLAMATAFAVAPEHNANEPLALQRERRLGHGYPTVQAEWSRAGIPGVVDHAVGFKLLTFESLISGTARNVAKLEARYARRASPPAPQPTP